LDQNAWIDLFRESYGDAHDPQVEASLNHVKDSVVAGRAIYPISLVHMLETSHQVDPERRDSLADFMYDVSRGWAIYPFPVVIDVEVRSLAFELAGIPTLGRKWYTVIGIGIGHLLGGKPTVVFPAAPKIQEELQKVVEGPGLIKWAMMNDQVMRRAAGQGSGYAVWINDMEQVRSDLATIGDLRVRRRFDLYNHLAQLILPRLSNRISAMGLALDFPPMNTESEVVAFAKRTPTAYCLWTLSYNLARDVGHRLVANDFRDLASLSGALGYCDIIVTERRWTSAARQEGLDREFGSTALNSVRNLGQHL
jgi:hypothetical protein